MSLHGSLNGFHAGFGLSIAAVALAWWILVPQLMTSMNFVALAGIFGGFVVVVRNTFENARPASSVAQSLHDLEAVRPVVRARRG